MNVLFMFVVYKITRTTLVIVTTDFTKQLQIAQWRSGQFSHVYRSGDTRIFKPYGKKDKRRIW